MTTSPPLSRSRAVGRVGWAVVVSIWPLYAFLGVVTIGAASWLAVHGDPGLLLLVLQFWKIAVVGITGSFVAHECAHAVVLSRLDGVSRIDVESTPLRISLRPSGQVSRAGAALAAIAGPATCVALGCLMWWLTDEHLLAVIHLGHGAFLLPPSGDGRVLLTALRPPRPADAPA